MKRNCEKLLEQSLGDLLCAMNARMLKLFDDGHSRLCVLDALGVDSGYCKRKGFDCNECIRNWMDEHPF